MSKATTAAAPASKAAGASISLTATASASKAAGSAASTFAATGGPTRLGRLFLRALPPNSRRHFLPAFVMPLVPLLAAALASRLVAGPLAVAAGLLGVVYAFGVMPALDAALGDDVSAASAAQAAQLADDPAFRTLLRAYAVWHLALLAAAFHLVASGAAGGAALAAAGVSAGISNGILFVVAHELLHGGGADRALAGALLAPLCYCHWAQSHLAHHVKVATRADPSTARRGEPLWRFLARSIAGNLEDGFAAERARRARRGVPAWSPRNRALHWAAGPAALAVAAFYLYGARGLLYFALQATGGVLMLETVNFIEHWGLLRAVNPTTGRPEPVAPRHSWNASALYTNAVAFRLQRHSHHHARAAVPYQSLAHAREAPQLPAGYPWMMVLAALSPGRFRAAMERRLDALAAGARTGE